MAKIDVDLPDRMKDWVDAQATAGRYNDASDYVRDLIRRDQHRVDALNDIQRAIDDGFESGISERSIDQVLDAARQKVKAALTS